MTDKNGQQLTWLEWRSQQTGKSVEELRQEMSKRGLAGGKASKGRTLSAAHKKKLSEAYWRKNEKAN